MDVGHLTYSMVRPPLTCRLGPVITNTKGIFSEEGKIIFLRAVAVFVLILVSKIVFLAARIRSE